MGLRGALGMASSEPCKSWEKTRANVGDETKLNEFVGRMLGDLGGAVSVPLVRIGDRLGLYKALYADGPMTPAELATNANVAERYAREWLSHQAASGYLTYDSKTGKFTLPQNRRWCSPTRTVDSQQANHGAILPSTIPSRGRGSFRSKSVVTD